MARNQNQQFDKMIEALEGAEILCKCCYYKNKCNRGVTLSPNGPIYPPCNDSDSCFDVDKVVEEYNKLEKETE